ncbi:MAG: hypothetical protein J6R18_00235 [Kiritimatiellae bacterium]|nr:hypothetical protein [Kiritimatiellia bacterium]
MRYLVIIIGAVLVNNFVLSRFLGCCPFLGVSKKTETALGMSGAVVFVMTVAAAVTWLLDHYLLVEEVDNFEQSQKFFQFLLLIIVIY